MTPLSRRGLHSVTSFPSGQSGKGWGGGFPWSSRTSTTSNPRPGSARADVSRGSAEAVTGRHVARVLFLPETHGPVRSRGAHQTNSTET